MIKKKWIKSAERMILSHIGEITSRLTTSETPILIFSEFDAL